jgi:small subunit ribosomal protein S16
MLVIRLQRVGKKKQASFRVVLQEHTWAPQGKAKELLGFYNPIQKEKKFHEERVKYWLSKGAQPSPTVHNLMIDAGILTGAKRKAWTPKKKEKAPETAAPTPAAEKEEKKKEEAAAEPQPEAAKAEVAESPAVEEKPEETKAEKKEAEAAPAKEEVQG